MKERDLGLSIFCHAVLIFAALLVGLPLYFAFVAGSLSIQEVQQTPFPWLPGRYFFANVVEAWNTGDFARSFANSMIVTTGIVVGKLAISLIAAYAVTYFRFPFRMTAFWLIFVSLMLPVEVRIIPTYEAVADTAGPIRWALSSLGISGAIEALTGYQVDAYLQWNMVNTYSGLVLPLIASATATFFFRQFFMTVPDELVEAARIDGAGPLRFLWDVLIPLSRTNIAALFVILFIYGWRQYLWPLMVSTEVRYQTIVLSIGRMMQAPEAAFEWPIIMATALLALLPPVVVVVLMQRWFVKGLVETEK